MADEPQRFCLGIAYMPGKDRRITKGADGGRDFLTEAELEKAAWSFLRSGPQVNAFHMAGTEGVATVVESSIHRGPDWDLGDGIVVTKGTWLVGAILEPKAWQAALDGRMNGWSPEGIARRRKVLKEGAVSIAKGAMPDDGDEEFSELIDCDFPKIGLVGKGANGIPRFLVMKNADGDATGLLEPEFVRDLIAKAEPEPARERAVLSNGITLNGSPADIAAFIHKASELQEQKLSPATLAEIIKAKNDAADRKHKAGTGAAMPDGSYPIADEADLAKAIRAVGRGGDSHNAIRKHVMARARSLGASSKIPDNWAADGSLKEEPVSKTEAVAKDMGPDLDDGIDGMDPTVPLAEPDEMGAGDPTDPGSPAWESIDAATAQKWTSILARARVAVDLLSEREMLEAASADPDDMCNAMDLQDVCCAIDYAIGVLAPFAVAEQSEADCGEADMMAMVGKSAGTDPAVFAQVAKAMATDLSLPLQQLEYFGAVVAKSGRVLSSVNEAHIREAHARLNTVLSSLPQAPVTDDGQPVAKEKETAMAVSMNVGGSVIDAAAHVEKEASPEAQAKNTGPIADGQVPGMGAIPGRPANETMDTPSGRKVLKSAVFDQRRELLGLIDPDRITQVVKADGDGGKPAQVAVYDADGNLVGVANPDDITPLANVKAPASDDANPDGADAAPAPDPADMTPAPAAETGTPADAVDPDGIAKSGQVTLTRDVLKSIVAETVTALLGAQAPAQDIAKQADVAGLSEQVETLKARLATVEEQPAAPKVFTNGQVPPAHQMRGQDKGAPPPVDIAKAKALKETLYRGTALEQQKAFKEMESAAVDGLAALHAQRR